MSTGTNKQRLNQNNTIILNNNDDIDALKTRINNLPDSGSTTATASDILSTKTAISKGVLITGTLGTEEKTVKSTTTSQTVLPTSGKLINKITVSPLDLETINVTPTSSAQTITPTSGKDGISQVNVSAVPSPNLQNKSETITTNTTTTIEADSGYDGLGTVTIITNVPQTSVPDWTQIGYSGAPQALLDDFAYSKDIYDNWSNVANLSQKFNNNKQIVYMPLVNTSNATNMYRMFYYCTNLKSVPQLNMNNVTNTSQMFYHCSSLKFIPQLNTGNITDMTSMFEYCDGLIIVEQLDGSNANSMGALFSNCSNLTTVTLIHTGNVSDMSRLFEYCGKLTSFSGLDTGGATNLSRLFFSCSSLITVPQLDTGNATNMQSMFQNCSNLVTIPQLDTSSVTNMGSMFRSCDSLSNESLNNILAMCIGATSYAGTKTLKELWISQTQATTCQTLSNYQDFIDAGWTTGY